MNARETLHDLRVDLDDILWASGYLLDGRVSRSNPISNPITDPHQRVWVERIRTIAMNGIEKCRGEGEQMENPVKVGWAVLEIVGRPPTFSTICRHWSYLLGGLVYAETLGPVAVFKVLQDDKIEYAVASNVRTITPCSEELARASFH